MTLHLWQWILALIVAIGVSATVGAVLATRDRSGHDQKRAETPPVTDNDFRDKIREMIQHEDQLRNMRLGWLLTLNGFLFAGLGFAWSRGNGWLIPVFAVVGAAVSISGFASMMMSDAAVRELSGMAEPATPKGIRDCIADANVEDVELDKLKGMEPVMGARRASYRNRMLTVLLYPWKVLPIVLTLTWIAVPLVRVATT
jgi:hypothetical protein